MFRERVDQTPFTSEEADYYFKNIQNIGTPYAGDQSFLATIRAFYGGRLGENDSITVSYRSYELSKSDADRMDDEQILNRVLGPIADDISRFTVVELTNSETVDRVMKVIREKFTETYGGWEPEPTGKVEGYYMRAFPVLSFINNDLRSSIFVTDMMTLRKWHYIQASVLRCIPWYLSDDNPVTDDEKALLKSVLDKTSSAEYLKILGKMVVKYDFEKSRIKRLLNGFETVFEKRRLDALFREVDNKRNQIEQYNSAISSMLAELREANYKIIGLQQVIKDGEGESQLMDYFLADRRLGLESSADGDLYFTVKGYIENYSEDDAEAVLDNPRSLIYNDYSTERINHNDMARLLRAVFIDREIKLRSCAAYYFSTGGSSIRCKGQSHKRFSAEFSTYMPNPHIQEYGCMGTNERAANEMLQDGNYVGAIVQCEVSCNNLNWNDYTVLSNFITMLYKQTTKCFELEDGTCVDQIGAVEWLNKKEA